MSTLAERITGYVRQNPASTLDDIARGVRARTADVRDVLLGGSFSAAPRLAYPSDRAKVYSLASGRVDGQGRAKKPSQCDLIAKVLADGRWHTAAEIHDRCGFSRLNSRVAELRSRRRLHIVCEHVDGMGSGPDAYRYQLVGTSEATDGCATAGLGPSVASDASADPPVTIPSEASDSQLALGAAA